MGGFLLIFLVLFPMAGAVAGYLTGRKNKSARDWLVLAVTVVELLLSLIHILVPAGAQGTGTAKKHGLCTGMHQNLEAGCHNANICSQTDSHKDITQLRHRRIGQQDVYKRQLPHCRMRQPGKQIFLPFDAESSSHTFPYGTASLELFPLPQSDGYHPAADPVWKTHGLDNKPFPHPFS